MSITTKQTNRFSGMYAVVRRQNPLRYRPIMCADTKAEASEYADRFDGAGNFIVVPCSVTVEIDNE